MLIQRCNTGLNLNGSLQCALATDSVHHGLQVGRSGSAAAANQAETELLYKLLVSGRQFIWCERVVGAVALQNWQTSIRHHHNWDS